MKKPNLGLNLAAAIAGKKTGNLPALSAWNCEIRFKFIWEASSGIDLLVEAGSKEHPALLNAESVSDTGEEGRVVFAVIFVTGRS